MKQTKKQYKRIIILAKRNKLNFFDLITNYGLLSGDMNLFKTLKIFELLISVKDIKGDIIELGIHRGNTSLLIKKILDIFQINKRLYLLDHFKGLTHYSNKDPQISKKFLNKYKSTKKITVDFLKFFKLKNVTFINKDATKIDKNFFKNKKFSFVYFDMDLYEPTITALHAINKSLVKGGLIVFDEGNKKLWAGEKKAIKEFLEINKNYKYNLISKNRQPDVVLKKFR